MILALLTGRIIALAAFVLVLGLLVFIHEGGHFAAAKRVGIKVEEFALGMGPRIWSRKRGETLYSLRILPLGGFCRMAGEDGRVTEGKAGVQTEDLSRQFYAKNVAQRALVIGAGPVMNLVLAALLYSVIFGVFGLPIDWVSGPVLGEISPGTPAAEAGLLPGDRILSIDGTEVRTWEEMALIIEKHPGQQIRLTVERPGRTGTFEVPITPQRITRPDTQKEVGFIGIVRKSTKIARVGLIESIKLGIMQTVRVIIGTVVGLYQLVTGQVQGPISGPVGIARMTGQAAKYGVNSLLELTAFLSIQLGLLNLLPVPALDGGRLAFLSVEAIRKKPVNPEKEGLIHFIGFALLMLLLLVITLKDLEHIFW